MLVLRPGLASSFVLVVVACGGSPAAGSGTGGAATGSGAGAGSGVGGSNCYSTSSYPSMPLTDDEKTRTCGSDGKIYALRCELAAAGVTAALSGCIIPQDSFACDSCVCKKGTEFCVHPVLYNHSCYCSTLPAACAPTPSCDCLKKDENCAAACTVDANGEISVQCNHG